MTDRDALLAGIVADPLEETRWLVLADWLEEFDDPRRAELLRLHRRMLATCCEADAHPERSAWQARIVELLIAGVRPCVPQETLTLPGGVPMTFSFIPPGAFRMGNKNGRQVEQPVHRVKLTRGFFMGTFPVTQAQWFKVMGTAPSRFKGNKRPVEHVSWNESQEFCTRLWEICSRRITLPTEAEWEYACRAGTTTRYHFGDEINTDWANYAGYSQGSVPKQKSRKRTTDVDSFPPNPWGLFDVHGNVYEWCQDWYSAGYTRKTEPDPQGAADGTVRVLRSSPWYFDSSMCESAIRSWHAPEQPNHGSGLRVCLRLS